MEGTYSAITDNPKYFEARLHSPLQRNWGWTPPLKNAVHIVKDPFTDQHKVTTAYERIIADDSILPKLESETQSPKDLLEMPAPHPLMANNGSEMMREFGFTEEDAGEVVWK